MTEFHNATTSPEINAVELQTSSAEPTDLGVAPLPPEESNEVCSIFTTENQEENLTETADIKQDSVCDVVEPDIIVGALVADEFSFVIESSVVSDNTTVSQETASCDVSVEAVAESDPLSLDENILVPRERCNGGNVSINTCMSQQGTSSSEPLIVGQNPSSETSTKKKKTISKGCKV